MLLVFQRYISLEGFGGANADAKFQIELVLRLKKKVLLVNRKVLLRLKKLVSMLDRWLKF